MNRKQTCVPRCFHSSSRCCRVWCSQFVPPPRTCRFSISPSSCRCSTAPSSTAATQPSSVWREYQTHTNAHMSLCTTLVLTSPYKSINLLYVYILGWLKKSVTFLMIFNASKLCVCSFPSCHFGKLYGLVMALSAVFSLLQYPCFALVKGPLDGDPLYVSKQHIINTTVNVSLALFPL